MTECERAKRKSGAKKRSREAKRASERHEKKYIKVSGDNSERDPPVPIPNTEVKPLSAEGTWLATAREIRTSPDSTKHSVVNT